MVKVEILLDSISISAQKFLLLESCKIDRKINTSNALLMPYVYEERI